MQNYLLLIPKTLRFALLATCLAAMASPATPQAQQPAPAPENNKPVIPLRVTTPPSLLLDFGIDTSLGQTQDGL
jgi:hypothetical protein